MRKELNNEKVHEQNLMATSKQVTNQRGIRYIIIQYVMTMGKMASTNIREDYDQHRRQVHYVQS